MKVKNLFLSMCAIAALASCSQNEDAPAPTGSDAPEAKVTINFAGDGAATRTLGSDNAQVNNLTAFFFNSSGALIKTPLHVTGDDLNTTMTLTTTTDASQVVLVANTATGTDFGSVTNITKLKEFIVSSLTKQGGSNDYIVNQTATNLTMSGWGAITMHTDNNTGEANVTLHFVAAKIKTLKVSWGTANQGHYAENESAVTGDKWFTIKQAYLMMAQTNSTLIPSTATATAWTGDFTPSAFAYAGGLAWGAAPWLTAPTSTNPVKVTAYLDSTIPNSTGDAVTNILSDDNLWYVFENNSSNPTGIILEVVCNINDEHSAPQKKTKYFTVYFGEKKTGETGNQENIKGGKTYDISLTLNGSFNPAGGTGGGGTDDPTKPSVDASVSVTVTPADWTSNIEIKKDFN